MTSFHEKVFKNREISAWLVQRAETYKAIVLTVDMPQLGRREMAIKNKMIAPQLQNLEGFISTEVVTDKGSGPEAFANSNFDSSLCWKMVVAYGNISMTPGVKLHTSDFPNPPRRELL